jgi:hypothetical protein
MKNSLPSNNLASYRRTAWPQWFLSAMAAAGLSLASQLPAQAQSSFPINEAFTGPSTSKFTLGGNTVNGVTTTATLTGTSTTPGYLRLTTNAGNQAGYAILNGYFPAPQGFNISFEFFSFGGSGADGISVFLVDAAGTDPTVSGQFGIGAYGGSLGYAQKTTAGGASDINGVTKGYLGIGIDEYGNYSTSSEGRVGGYSASGNNTTTLIPQSVALRGPVGASRLQGYSFLKGSGTLPFTLSIPGTTTEAQASSPNYRKAYINVVPVAGGTYQITVRIQHGTTVTTAINAFPVSTPPDNLRVGFAASTGGADNYHEIRNLNILQNPFAGDDGVVTKYNTPITFSLVANDKGIGAALNYASLDLDPTATGRQTTYTVAGQGTFTLNDNATDGTKSTVTFTPVAGFAGIVSIPYVISDLLGQVSDQATIVVNVTGADVATSVSGPAAVTPGGQVTYTVATTNIGTEVATNIRPTLQLPTGLPIPASPNYTYDSGTGLVTFTATTLASGTSAPANSVTFTVPTSGVNSIPATSGYVYPVGAVVPDPVVANNSTTLTTTVTGSATVPVTCATPGKDGPGALTNNDTPNTYYPGVSTAVANGVSTITVGTASGGTVAGSTTPTPIAAGDLVMIMQMQDGLNMTTTANSSNYGSFLTTASTAGIYEYATVAGVTGSVVTLNRTLTNTYTKSATQNFQVIRIPQYSSLKVTGVVSGAAWNSVAKVGGVLALDVAGSTTFTGTTPGLSMTGRGFSGGAGKNYNSAVNSTGLYATTVAAGGHGTKGEGFGGTPANFYNGAANSNGDGYPTGDNNIGDPANGGGGGCDASTTNSGNSGGGGGSNYAAGGSGGYGSRSGGVGSLASGGDAYQLSAKQLIMGGGGGAGSTNDGTSAVYSSGGMGGGIIVLRTATVSGSATIQANGSAGPSTAANAKTQGGGGGGAGGTILVLTTPSTSTSLTTLTASAAGGAGGSVNLTGGGGTSYGPGGGGGGGVVYANSSLNAASSAASGTNGTTTNTSFTNYQPIAFGATKPSNDGIIITNTNPTTGTNTTGGANACLPMLSVALSTATPNIQRSSTTSTPSPASYTATVSNVGNTVTGASVAVAMDPQFTYTTTATSLTLTTAAGVTTTLVDGINYTAPTAGASSPVFSGLTIPSGATLRINYRAAIATSSVTNYAYQAAATVAFTDPTRAATTTDLATPGATFATGGGTVPGVNYAAATSTNEDVTLVDPLPVELTRFAVLAVRQDAILTWSTASERNNDHFAVERSLTGSSFVAVGTVRGQGNTLKATDYIFTDSNAGRLASSTVYYRLKQVDLDGTATYSPVRTVQFSATAKAGASLYPNPSQGQIVLDLSTLAEGNYSVQVLDLTGRVLRIQQSTAKVSTLDLSGLPQGAYLVLVQGSGVRQALPLLRN